MMHILKTFHKKVLLRSFDVSFIIHVSLLFLFLFIFLMLICHARDISSILIIKLVSYFKY